MAVIVDDLLSVLPPFTNKSVLIESAQDVPDIVREVMAAHEYFSTDYDYIWQFFYSDDLKQTCKNLFNFCKRNIAYVVEGEDRQTTKSPSAILAMSYGDCKHYAGFIAGVLSAIVRNTGADIPFKYRFASYDTLDRSPGHVFVVVYDRGNEIWIDPVLNSFDERLQPFYVVDKKIKSMPLYRMSGLNYYDSSIGVVSPETIDAALESAEAIVSTAFEYVEGIFADQVSDYPVKKSSTFDSIAGDVINNVGTVAPRGIFRIRPATVSQAAEMLKRAYKAKADGVWENKTGAGWSTGRMLLAETTLALENIIAYATQTDIIPTSLPGGTGGANGINPVIASVIIGILVYLITKKITPSVIATGATYFIMPKKEAAYVPEKQPYTSPIVPPVKGGGAALPPVSDLFGLFKNIFGGGTKPVDTANGNQVFI